MAMRRDVGMNGISGYPTENEIDFPYRSQSLTQQGTADPMGRSSFREKGINERLKLGAPMSAREKDYVRAGIGKMVGNSYSEEDYRAKAQANIDTNIVNNARRKKLAEVNAMYPQAQYAPSPQMKYAKKQGPVSKAMGVVNTKPGMPPRQSQGQPYFPSK
jgi:hypothetical protein